MKHILRSCCASLFLLFSSGIKAQSPVVCPINAGIDQTICAPNCANLVGTFVPGNQTTAYTISTVPYAPDPFTAGTNLPLGDDQWSSIIPLPFTFCYYGVAYNQCIVGSNGCLSFTTVGPMNTPLGYCQWPIGTAVPNGAGSPQNTIMTPWQDLYLPAGGSLKYTTYGSTPCRRFVVSWNAVPMYACNATLCTQQIVLYETTNIIDNFIQTKPLCAGWNGGKAIQAITNPTGAVAFFVAGRNSPTQWTCVNDGKRYTPSGPSTCVTAWYQGATFLSNNPNFTVCPPSTTTYTFQATYTNCNNTQVTVSDQMIVNVSTLTTTAGPDQSICQGGCANLVGNAVGAISYSWVSLPGNTNVGNTAAITVCPATTTTYVVTATSPACAGTDTVVVNIFIMNTASAGPDDTVCSGSCTTLQGSGGVSYSWAPAGSITGSALIANPQACPTVTTTYTVTVVDANGCIGTDSATVYVAPQVLSATLTPINVTCFGACNGSVTANPSGGFTPYTYLWSNGATTQTANGICAGPISVTITDAIGCTTTQNTVITQPTAVLIQSTAITTANCGQNDGSVTITVSGGNGPYIILWPASGNSGLVENNLPPGQVCVYAYDANGCGDTLCVNVPNTPGAVVNITSFGNVTCFNACNGWAVGTAAGGTGPYNFVWNTAPQNQLNDTASNLCPGSYTVTMTDANGCQDSAVATITQPTQVTNVAAGATTICIGQSANLTDVANGGTPGYTYSWTDGVNNWNTQNISVSPIVTTTYTVFVTDANGCISANQTVVVTVNPPLQVQAMAGITVCSGTNVNLTAVGNGGNGVYTYNWQPINQNGASVNTVVNATTTYTVTLTDGCGSPAATSTVTVTVNPNPNVNITATTATSGCEPLCVTFTNNTPNTASINWTFGANLGTSTLNNPTFCFNAAGTYDVSAIVTDNIGCIGTTTLSNYITVWPLPTADFSAFPQPATLLNNQVTFTDLSSGAVSWIWSFGADDSASVLQNPTYAFLDTGAFNVQLIVTNQYGCQDSTSMPIYVHQDYALFIPNTFTPNGDGHNDTFFPQGIGVNPDKFQMFIFDRWGNTIYKTEVWPGGWDGTVQGTNRLCQIDTYVYKIITTDPEGSRKVYIGHVNLIR
jgi:gliding motility-associated-like protein